MAGAGYSAIIFRQSTHEWSVRVSAVPVEGAPRPPVLPSLCEWHEPQRARPSAALRGRRDRREFRPAARAARLSRRRRSLRIVCAHGCADMSDVIHSRSWRGVPVLSSNECPVGVHVGRTVDGRSTVKVCGQATDCALGCGETAEVDRACVVLLFASVARSCCSSVF